MQRDAYSLDGTYVNQLQHWHSLIKASDRRHWEEAEIEDTVYHIISLLLQAKIVQENENPIIKECSLIFGSKADGDIHECPFKSLIH